MDRPGGDDGRPWMWAGVGVATVAGLWITAGVWGSRPPAGDDIQGQLLWNEFAVDKLFAHGRMDGWFPGFIVGYQKFLHYGPGFTWLVALVRVVTFGLLSTPGAVKVIAVLSYLAVPAAVAFLVRSMGLDGRAAGIAAVLTLAVDSPYGLGLAGLFIVGLLPQQVAATWLIVALGGAFRVLHDRRIRWIVLTAVAGLMLLLTHPISVMMLAVFAVFAVVGVVVGRRAGPDGWRRLGAAAVAVVAVGAFWIIPYVAHRHLAGVLTAWATPPIGDRVGDVLSGRFLLHRYMGFAALLGMVAYAALAVARRLRLPLAPVLLPLGYLVVAHTTAHFWRHSAAGTQLANRGVGLVGVLALIPLSVLLAAAGKRFGAVATGGTIALVLVAGVLIPGTGRDEAHQQARPKPQFTQIASILHRVVPAGARFATERDFPAEIVHTGVSHPDFWLARHSGRDTLNVFGIELTPAVGAGIQPERLDVGQPRTAADALAHFGVTHVVTMRPETANELAADPNAFVTVWRSVQFAVLAVEPRPGGSPEPVSLLDTTGHVPMDAHRVDGGRPEHVRIDTTVATDAGVTAAIGYSPKWHLRIDGRPAPLHASRDGILSFAVPAGHHRLALDFRSDGWDRIGWTITLLSLAGLALLAGRAAIPRRARNGSYRVQSDQRTGRPSSSSRMSSSRSFTA